MSTSRGNSRRIVEDGATTDDDDNNNNKSNPNQSSRSAIGRRYRGDDTDGGAGDNAIGGNNSSQQRQQRVSATAAIRSRRALSSAAALTGSSTPTTTPTSGEEGGESGNTRIAVLTHEDEIERIREMRARRLREEGGGTTTASSTASERARSPRPEQARSSRRDSMSTTTTTTPAAAAAATTIRSDRARSPRPDSTSTTTSSSTIRADRARIRRSDLGSTSSRAISTLSGTTTSPSISINSNNNNNPSRVRSSPSISRKELEEAGLVRERRPSINTSSTITGGGLSPNSSSHNKRDLSPRQQQQQQDHYLPYSSRRSLSSTGGVDSDDAAVAASLVVGPSSSSSRTLAPPGRREELGTASAYARARRERLAAATATSAAAASGSATDSYSNNGVESDDNDEFIPLATNTTTLPTTTSTAATTTREREYIQRADIEARMAARRNRRNMDDTTGGVGGGGPPRHRSEAVVGGSSSIGTASVAAAQISLEELRNSRLRDDRDQPRSARRLSMSDRSVGSLTSRSTQDSLGSLDSQGNIKSDQHQQQQQQRTILSRSSTTDGLQTSARERIRERLQRGTPQRSSSASELDEMNDDNNNNNNNNKHDDDDDFYSPPHESIAEESFDEREVRRLDRQQQRPPRLKSTDLSVRLRERREARAAEREARDRERKDYTSELDTSRRSSGHNDEEQRRRYDRMNSSATALDEADMDSSRRSFDGDYRRYDRELDTSRRSTTGEEEVESFVGGTSNNNKALEDTDPENDGTPIPELEITDDEGESDTSPGWSVRLCVISAMDLPLNVVPNMPLCPVLKFGLVKIPGGSKSSDEQSSTSSVFEKLGRRSIESVQSARVRTTTPKVLSKRDNGTVDFHQEYRWDQVQKPMNIGLCVELCARAVRTPKNYKESPPAFSHQDSYVSPMLPPRPPSSSGASGRATPSDEVGQSSTHTDSHGGPVRGVARTSSGSQDDAGLRRFWGRGNRKQAELEAAEAAAAVARMLVDQENGGGTGSDPASTPSSETIPPPFTPKAINVPNADYDVTLSTTTEGSTVIGGMTEDMRLGSLVIPLTKLPLDKATIGNESVRIEQWYQLETFEDTIGTTSRRKKPSILLEISFSTPEILDDSEDELEEGLDDQDETVMSTGTAPAVARLNAASFARRATIEARGRLKETEKQQEEPKTEDPVLEPGVIDFVVVVGCKDVGNQKKDDGMKGWVNTTPESVIMEQFPPDNDFHAKNGRNVLLPEMVQWFCFPEGARLWRGPSPPSHSDLNLKRFSAGSPLNIASSIAAFDACLNCTTSFSWFVIASNSDEYGSTLVKTYGAVIRFYVPAPSGIDPTQDDFAQAVMGQAPNASAASLAKRLWVPMGICMTSSLPIIGIIEAMLLRLCEEFSALVGAGTSPKLEEIHMAIGNLILNFQKPIPGAVNCSVPFIAGDRFLLSLPPRTGLPPLPHGRAVLSVCRLLGAEGINFMIAAVLTECKILIHSQEIADIALVAEVITALTYPFAWSMPYIPILPLGMIEFVEAPLSYILGIPSCNLQLIDPRAFDDIVVVDLDSGCSSTDYFQGKKQSRLAGNNKYPNPLPASVATNISKAVYNLLRAEEEVEEEFGDNLCGQSLPRLEAESLAEREFRVTVAVEICGLLRGYQDCVGPVFDRDKFLKTAPALFEERRESRGLGPGLSSRNTAAAPKTISIRSKRFLSMLVSGQNFQQLLESLSSDEATFFHEILEAIDETSSDSKPSLPVRLSSADTSSSKTEKIIAHLVKSLQKIEDKIPTYRVEKGGGLSPGDGDDDDGLFYDDDDNLDDFDDFPDDFPCEGDMMIGEERIASTFTSSILSPIPSENESGEAVSMEYLAKLEANPWGYSPLFDVPVSSESGAEAVVRITEKVKLRDAIGERRFRAWKLSQDKTAGGEVDLAFVPENTRSSKQGSALELTSLVSSARRNMDDTSALSAATSDRRLSSLNPEQQKVVDAKSRDIIRRCLDRAQASGNSNLELANAFIENGRDLMAESEKALRNPSAQLFLLAILAQRSRLENQKVRSMRRQSAIANAASRLDPIAFDCLVRLSCAMLDSCMEFAEYELAYRLLTYTAGFIMVLDNDEEGDKGDGHARLVVTMTSRVGLHPIFANLGVWETVMTIHLRDRKSARKLDDTKSNASDDESGDDEEDEVEYEAAVATLYEMLGYGIPGEELSRFAMRASEEHGWFCDDRGRQLLMLARRISIRRDQTDMGGAGESGDIDMVRKSADDAPEITSYFEGATELEKHDYSWTEVGWCHPAAPSSRTTNKRNIDVDTKLEFSSPTDDYMKRSAVTALASFGSSIVVSGGLDGGVFLAHSIFGDDETGRHPEVRGLHLDWGSASRAGAGSSSDGEYGVGAVSCLAAAHGGGQASPNAPYTKDTGGAPDETDFADSMEGSRVVAGTTAGDLRVWSVKDIYTAIQVANREGDISGSNASTRLKFSLRGRALSGHRGGVTCIDVPSQVYRPDSLVTGGADGMIKLWSLRAPTAGRRAGTSGGGPSEQDTGSGGQQQRGRGGDALNTLSGHTGRVLCIKSAWHGDHLLSGGADRTIRVWDLAASGGKCIHRLCGHFGWITNVQYWGPNTIVSASTDRSVALWDARVRNSPLFMLRHHKSPISDLLVGTRTDPYMVSAGADGTVATWDFRSLSGGVTAADHGGKEKTRSCRIVRLPSASIRHGITVSNKKGDNNNNNKSNNAITNYRAIAAGSVQLARDLKDPFNSFMSVGSDAVLREWDLATGDLVEEYTTGHCDAISNFRSFAPNEGFHSSSSSTTITSPSSSSSSNYLDSGTLTSSWDGTIRMRKLVRKIHTADE